MAKPLLGEVAPWTLASLLYLGSGIGLALVRFGIRGRGGEKRAEAPLRRGDLPWLGAAILAGGVAAPVLLLMGLAGMASSSASLLLNLEGVFTLGIAWLVFRENVDVRVGTGAAAILAGAAFLSWNDGASFGSIGPALCVAGACLGWAIDNNLTRKLANADALQIAMVKGLAAGIVDAAIAQSQGLSWPSPPVALTACVIGFFGYGISLTFFVLALRHLGAARTGAYFSTAPFIGASLGLAVFGEPMTVQFIAAALLMAFGVWMHLIEDHAHDHIHDEMIHEHRHTHDAHHHHTHDPLQPEGEPHTHVHTHVRLVHRHPHYPDSHHRHVH